MGCRVLGEALENLADKQVFDHIVLAAPDILVRNFRENVGPKLIGLAKHVTIYASSNDDALDLSKILHAGEARVGQTDGGVFVMKDIDTIDVSDVCRTHAILGSTMRVLRDLYRLLAKDLRPIDRFLDPRILGEMHYWVVLKQSG